MSKVTQLLNAGADVDAKDDDVS